MALHILMFNDRAAELSGAEVMFHTERRLLAALPDTRVSVFSIETRPSEPCCPSHTIYRESPNILLNKAAKITRNLPLYRRLRRTLRTLNPDVVYLHKNAKYPVDVLRACAGRPILHRVHDYDLVCPTAWCVRRDTLAPCPGGFKAHCLRHCLPLPLFACFYAPFVLRREPLLRRHLSACLCPSQALTEMMARHVSIPCHHLPYPMDLTQLPVRPRPPARPALLYVGLLGEHKGVGRLLDAMPAIRAHCPGVTLTLVGEGAQQRAFQRRAAALGLSGQVTFTGRIPHAEIVRHYHAASLVVLPSLWMENSSVVLHEALAMGVPCAGSRRGGIPELLGNGAHGALFDPTDPASIAGAVSALLADPGRQAACAEAGRRFILERARPEAFTTAFRELADRYRQP